MILKKKMNKQYLYPSEYELSRVATTIGKWFPVSEGEKFIEGDLVYKRYLIYDQYGRPMAHYSECMHIELGGYLWDSRYSGKLHIPSIDCALYWINS